MNGRALALVSVAGLVAAGLVARRGSRSQPTWEEERQARAADPISSTWYHLTDRAKFKLDMKFMPGDNSIGVVDRSGRPGIYLAPDVEPWLNGQGYWRPFVAEFGVDPSVRDDPGVHGRWGGEMFVPAASFGKLVLQRVIPLDAHAREVYGDYGWIEEALGRTFDTNEPVAVRRARDGGGGCGSAEEAAATGEEAAMNGRDLTLASLAGLVAAGLVARRRDGPVTVGSLSRAVFRASIPKGTLLYHGTSAEDVFEDPEEGEGLQGLAWVSTSEKVARYFVFWNTSGDTTDRPRILVYRVLDLVEVRKVSGRGSANFASRVVRSPARRT